MKQIVLVLLVVMLLVVPIYALSHIELEKPRIKAIGVIGKGIAISAADATDFTLVRIGIARVLVTLDNETEEVNAGVLFAEDTKYKLKNIVIGDGEATADIFKNDSQVGSISVASVTKGDIIVWAGTMDLNGKNYNVYLLEFKREVKPHELKDKIADFCKANRSNPNCRERMHEFCENNPDDARCKQLFREYCAKHLDDARCRDAIKEFCKNNPDNRICNVLEVRVAKKYCEEHPDDDRCEKVREIKQRHRITETEIEVEDDFALNATAIREGNDDNGSGTSGSSDDSEDNSGGEDEDNSGSGESGSGSSDDEGTNQSTGY